MPWLRGMRQFQLWARGLRLGRVTPSLTLQLAAAQTSRDPALRAEAEWVSGASLTCAFIALSISDANLVLFSRSLWLKFMFHCTRFWGYAKSIPSVNSLLLNRDVTKIQSHCPEKEFREMQRTKASLLDPRSWFFQSALKERRQTPWEVASLLLTILLKKF